VPEGDTIFRAATTLNRALAGETITNFQSAYPALTRIHHDRPLTGRIIESVTARGKHLLMTFSGDLTLHTHMRMHGSWHIYRPGEPWRHPARDMRVVVETARYVAVGFNVPVAELLTAVELVRHPQLSNLGPDLAQPDFDRAEAVRRLEGAGADPIETALLNQRVVAGIGNVFKSEVLFLAGIHPLTRVRDLDAARLGRLLDVAVRAMKMSTASSAQTLSAARGRRTTGSLDPNATLWVYGRGGKPCRRCGTIIDATQSPPDARLTYWCPECQRG
jgi:endonuclease-8